ncbi:restriction endonuclease subunit S [Rhizobium wenxiniae]|nr:restriction endonuclease subunit S [Rhizobium wenxiniae]
MPQNIGDNAISEEGIARISVEDAKRLTRYRLRTGDIVYSRRGDVEKRSLVRPNNDGWLCGTGCLRIRFGEGHVLPEYAAYYLAHPAAKAWVVQHAVGATMPNLNTTILGLLPFVLPPMPEQISIARILGSLDDKIELNRRMNETLEAMAQAVFRDCFVDFGPTRRKLEGATDPLTIMGGLVQDAERAQALADLFPAALGDDGLPEGWESKPLLDQANWVNGAAYKNMHFSDGPDALPVVKIAELKNGVTSSTKRTATALGERYRISDGELLFSWSGNPDTSIDAFVWIGGDAWLNQHIFAVRENGTRSRAALYVLLKALMPQFAELARNKQTTGLGHVTKEDMKRLEIAVAPGPVEAAFEEVITPIFNLIVSKLFENRTLAATRELLLPKLMYGEIRLSEAEYLMEAAQ